MGANFDYGWSDINQAFAAGNVGMYISGSDVYTNLVQASNIDPSIYGVAPIPLAKNKTAGVLGGGTLVAVRPDANAAAKAAAVKWIDFFYVRKLVTKAAGDPQRQVARREQAAGRRAGAAALQQGAVRPREHVDQAVHQRPRGADEAVHEPASSTRRLIPEPGGRDAGRVPRARPRRAGRPHRQEREHPQLLQQANSTAQDLMRRATSELPPALERAAVDTAVRPSQLHRRQDGRGGRDAERQHSEPSPVSRPAALGGAAPSPAHARSRGCATAG